MTIIWVMNYGKSEGLCFQIFRKDASLREEIGQAESSGDRWKCGPVGVWPPSSWCPWVPAVSLTLLKLCWPSSQFSRLNRKRGLLIGDSRGSKFFRKKNLKNNMLVKTLYAQRLLYDPVTVRKQSKKTHILLSVKKHTF